MAASTGTPFPRIQIARLEGRAQPLRYRQGQLQRLHSEMIRSKDIFKSAIAADTGHTSLEIDLEFALVLSELRLHYDSLNLQSELAIARQIENGIDNADRTQPVGIVYVVPAEQNLFYSVMAPLCAAITAGSCVIVEVSQASFSIMKLS